MTTGTLAAPPGLAGAAYEKLGDRARLCGVYDSAGAPVYHDLASGDALEVREIVREVRAVPGPVLDLAAGSGRFTFPLLALGREVTALDLSQDMLDLLGGRIAAAPERVRSRCTVVRADMAAFRLETRFAHIVLGATSLSLLDPAGQEGLCRAVAAHLEPGGHFLFTVLERGDAAGADEQVSRVTGASGTAYDLHDHWPAGAPTRTVTIIPADPPPGPVPVCTGEVGTTDVAHVERALAGAGLELTGRRPLSGPDDRHQVTLMKAVSAR
ncbi:daptide-type RiPP biosynthesis methyltransferase [Streptomyces sp. NPDC051569]|uniref:daptide-type RiPP biosynthesis methyltransferase n=1 Tax=Streptomyces sp. NPDC051569 TaxID=3365661 RepID=UPI00379AAFAE